MAGVHPVRRFRPAFGRIYERVPKTFRAKKFRGIRKNPKGIAAFPSESFSCPMALLEGRFLKFFRVSFRCGEGCAEKFFYANPAKFILHKLRRTYHIGNFYECLQFYAPSEFFPFAFGLTNLRHAEFFCLDKI